MKSSPSHSSSSPSLASVALHLLFLFGAFNLKLTTGTLIVAIVLYSFTAFSISAGYHRLWTHSSYVASNPLQLFMLFFGSSAFFGSVASWVATHQHLHKTVGTPKDIWARKGAVATYLSTFMVESSETKSQDSPLLEAQNRFYHVISIVSGLVLPAVICSLWGDTMGGIAFAGAGRVVLLQNVWALMNTLGRVQGSRQFSEEFPCDNVPLALLTFGDSYQNFHFTFPHDFRAGPALYDLDLSRIIIEFLSTFDLTSQLKRSKDVDLLKVKINVRQQQLDRMKAGIDFGPEVESLPIVSWAGIAAKIAKGAKWVVVDGVAHDVEKFIDGHPGGKRILESRVGKDATLAFNGGVYKHSKSARNLLAMFRVAKLPKDEVESRVNADDFKIQE